MSTWSASVTQIWANLDVHHQINVSVYVAYTQSVGQHQCFEWHCIKINKAINKHFASNEKRELGADPLSMHLLIASAIEREESVVFNKHTSFLFNCTGLCDAMKT